ncbi:MAG: hypothetical protein D6701_13060 [Gemmatimonadetes bacterium]|nr:MAG: hypothetical protein D6701_13060 [Gemmatimonadota bacterium]
MIFGGVLVLAGAAPAAPAAAQEGDVADPASFFLGPWEGTFESETKPVRDPAVQRRRDRAIARDGEMDCEGKWRLQFVRAGDEVTGDGVVEQKCTGGRGGIDVPPPERFMLSDIKIKDKGEGKDKELEFVLTYADDRLSECKGKLKFKPKDDRIEGDYRCTSRIRNRTSGQRTMEIVTRGELELVRPGT